MKRRTTLIVFLGLGIFFSYALYKPVPTGFPDPWKFRFMATVYQGFAAVNHIRMCIRDLQCPTSFDQMLDMFDLMQSVAPSPREEVPGSNIRSRLTSFDGIRVRVYEPITRDRQGPVPAFLYFHGGGLSVGSIDMFDPAARMVAERLNIVGIAVSYRLAPHHPFPAAFDDALKATKWLLTHAHELDIDANRVAVMGDSAGGLLTAVISGAISDDISLPDIKLQVLLYPWLQSLDLNTPSYQKMKYTDTAFDLFQLIQLMPSFTSAYVLGHADDKTTQQISVNNHTSVNFKNSPSYQKYLSHDLIPQEMRPECYASPEPNDFMNEDLWDGMKDALLSLKFSPLLREDMSKLPRAYIATCGYDVLRDDGIFYAERLKAAGVPVKWMNHENGFHGILWYGDFTFEIGRQMADGFIDYMKEHL